MATWVLLVSMLKKEIKSVFSTVGKFPMFCGKKGDITDSKANATFMV
jgi:hypothetical protein